MSTDIMRTGYVATHGFGRQRSCHGSKIVLVAWCVDGYLREQDDPGPVRPRVSSFRADAAVGRSHHRRPSMPRSEDPEQSSWALVREALRGTTRDLTEESIGRAVLLLAVPMVLEMAMESAFVVADIFWVAKLGADAVAAVGITEALMVIIEALAI